MTDPDVLVAGEALVDFHPDRPGQLSDVRSFSPRPGGAPANVAAGLARLGRPPWFWTRVGDDPFGTVLVDALQEYGVPDRFVERDPDAQTSLAFVGRDGEPSFTFYRDGTADTKLRAGTIGEDVLESIDWLSVGGVALSADPTRAAIVDLVERADSTGCTVVFDPNARPELWEPGGFRADVEALLRYADVVKATPADLALAGFDEDDPSSLARAVLDRGPHTALVTRGADGSTAVSTGDAPWGSTEAEHPGFDVDAVDSTGAGDAFVAGAISALADGDSLADALRFANAVAALATTAEGAMAALPDREAVDRFLG